MLDWPTLSGREAWLFFWQMCPIWISLTNLLLSSLIPDTTVLDRFKSPNRDLPVIRYTIGTLAAFSSIIWLWTCINSFNLHSILGLFVPETLPIQTTDFIAFTREFLKLDEVSLFGNTFLWLIYLFWDMKFAGMVQTSWPKLLLYLVSSVLILGPGGTAGLGWLWRENIIASTKHKDAITEASVARHDKSVRKELEK